MDRVINIWLEASIKAHDFVASGFWESKAEDMRKVYIPSGETYVYEEEGMIKGFLSLSGDTLAAVFVPPAHQGRGVGKQLMAKAKEVRRNLTLTVYKENRRSIEFYQKCGFQIQKEQIDEHTGHPELLMVFPA